MCENVVAEPTPALPWFSGRARSSHGAGSERHGAALDAGQSCWGGREQRKEGRKGTGCSEGRKGNGGFRGREGNGDFRGKGLGIRVT